MALNFIDKDSNPFAKGLIRTHAKCILVELLSARKLICSSSFRGLDALEISLFGKFHSRIKLSNYTTRELTRRRSEQGCGASNLMYQNCLTFNYDNWA